MDLKDMKFDANGVPVSYVKENTSSVENLVEEDMRTEQVPESRPAPGVYVNRAPEQPVSKIVSKKNSPSSIVNAFKNKLAACITPIKIYSADREVNFREMSVTEQKLISKTSIENQNRTDIMYSAQCALINKLADEKKFDIYDYTEFDRIVILATLYQSNYFKNDVTYKCPNCGRENVYRLDFSKILKRVADAYTVDKEYVVEAGPRTFKFTVGWPNVRCIDNFYRAYYRKYASSNDNGKNAIDQLANIEYMTMFIKRIELFPTNDPDDNIVADLEQLTYPERVEIIDSLQQGILFDENEGIMKKVADEFATPLNNCFQYEKCAYCGAETNQGMGSIGDFF